MSELYNKLHRILFCRIFKYYLICKYLTRLIRKKMLFCNQWFIAVLKLRIKRLSTLATQGIKSKDEVHCSLLTTIVN